MERTYAIETALNLKVENILFYIDLIAFTRLNGKIDSHQLTVMEGGGFKSPRNPIKMLDSRHIHFVTNRL